MRYRIFLLAVTLLGASAHFAVLSTPLQTQEFNQVPDLRFVSKEQSPFMVLKSNCTQERSVVASGRPKAGISCRAELANISGRPLRAYGVRTAFLNSEGKVIARHSQTVDTWPPLPEPRKPIQPAEEVILDRIFPPQSTAVVQVEPVFAEFEDESIWGQTDSAEHRKLGLSRMAMREVLKDLQLKLKNEGLQTAFAGLEMEARLPQTPEFDKLPEGEKKSLLHTARTFAGLIVDHKQRLGPSETLRLLNLNQ